MNGKFGQTFTGRTFIGGGKGDPEDKAIDVAAVSAARKGIPLQTGCYDYFPKALAAIAKLSKAGNDKHNPGQPLHWARDKSNDHADCIARHQSERGTVDPEDGFLHDVKVAWRALAQAELALEKQAVTE